MPHTFPKQLETERMILRLATPNEASVINKAVVETIEPLQKFMSWAHPTPDLQNTLNHINAVIADAEKQSAWRTFMYDKATGVFIGNCGFHSLKSHRAEIGYWCQNNKQGNGYITEAVNAITQFAFEELNIQRVEIKYLKDNIASASVAKRCDFKYESEAPYYHKPLYEGGAHTVVTTVKFNPSLTD